MKRKFLPAFLVAGGVMVSITSIHAQTWIAGADNFRTPTNWTPATVPGSGNTAYINNGGTASIGAGPDLNVGIISLGGDGSGSADLSGNITISAGVMLLSSSLNANSTVGNVAQNPATVTASVLKLDGGEIQVDDPAGILSGKSGLSKRFDYTNTGSNVWDTSGFNNKDLLVGNRSYGRLEMHNGAALYLGDDLGIGNNGSAGASQKAELVMDGTSLIAIGSGAEIGKLGASVTMNLSGHAKFTSGNSLGPGKPAGQTDEGYVTIGTRDSGVQNVTIADDAELQCMTIQNRQGTTEIDLTDRGQLKIYNVFSGSGTIVATRPSYIASGQPCNTTIKLRGSSSMLVDCQLGNAASGGSNKVNGLHVGGGENLQSAVAGDPGTYNSTSGGSGTLDIGDNSTLDIKQSLHLGFGTSSGASGTLRVTGPSAAVTIGGNLNLAFNEYLAALVPGSGKRPGAGILEYVITGPTQTPITVGGAARISNGILYLTLDNYIPPHGTRYTLISAASVDGMFRFADFSGAPLNGTDVWKIDVNGTSVTATVSDPYLIISTDPAANTATLTWPGPAVLQFSPDLMTKFVDVTDAVSPYETQLDAAKKFYRLRY